MAWGYYAIRFPDSRADSDADYRMIGKWISDRLTDLGWGKTADTGQIDWSTATRPGTPTANTIGGYEIRVSSGAGTDIYTKISYGMGYNTNCLGTWLQSGTGSDGTGTLTGIYTYQRQTGTAIDTTSPYEATWYVAGDTDNFVVGGTPSTFANGWLMGVQRTCDNSGVDTNTGWWQYSAGYTSAISCHWQYVDFTTGPKSKETTFGTSTVAYNLSGYQVGALYLPVLVGDGKQHIPLRDIMAQNWGTPYNMIDINHFGSVRRYVLAISTASANIWGYTHPYTPTLSIRIS